MKIIVLFIEGKNNNDYLWFVFWLVFIENLFVGWFLDKGNIYSKIIYYN